MEHIDTLVIGAGQGGVATSEHLRTQGIDHVVLERGRIAERWRSERWDSLKANGPAWHDRFPNMAFTCDEDDFADKESVAAYFEEYARMIDAPVRSPSKRSRRMRIAPVSMCARRTANSTRVVSSAPRARFKNRPFLQSCRIRRRWRRCIPLPTGTHSPWSKGPCW